jgi:glycosyltransferase involved in cell wall biosynthesis
VGLGPEKENLRMLSTRLGLSDICEFQGAQSPDKIALMMDEADIYVFPSDRNEGWGIVVNEAMSHRCCVIGSKDAGSVPWLIQDGVNGRIFDGKSVENLGQILRWCVDNNELRMEMGISARETITELWSPSVAAERFLTLCETSHKQQNSAFSDNGPCSPAF